jgi:hypothetical protein
MPVCRNSLVFSLKGALVPAGIFQDPNNHSPGAAVAALTDFCHALLNTSELIFLE